MSSSRQPGFGSTTASPIPAEVTIAMCLGDFDEAMISSADGRSVGGKVMDEDGDTREYTTTITVADVAPAVRTIAVPSAPVALPTSRSNASAIFDEAAGAADAPYACTVDSGTGGGPRAGSVATSTCTGPDHT